MPFNNNIIKLDSCFTVFIRREIESFTDKDLSKPFSDAIEVAITSSTLLMNALVLTFMVRKCEVGGTHE